MKNAFPRTAGTESGTGKIRSEKRFFVRANDVRSVPALRAIREETAMMRIEHGPHERAIARRNIRGIDFFSRKKSELPFVDFRRERGNGFETIEEKHQPMPAALVRTLRNHSEKMQIGRADAQAGFLERLAASAFKRRFARRHFEFPADGTPTPFVGRFSAPNHQKFSVPVANENQNADLERQRRRRGISCRIHNFAEHILRGAFPPLQAAILSVPAATKEKSCLDARAAVSLLQLFTHGEMAERSIAAVLKTVEPKGSGGSNPSLSAIFLLGFLRVQISGTAS